MKNTTFRTLTLTAITLSFLGCNPPQESRKTAECPTAENIATPVAKIFPPGTRVQSVVSSGALNLCQIFVDFDGQKRVFYTDSTGKYFFLGQIIDVADSRNLTLEAAEAANRLDAEDLEKLDRLTAFEVGKGTSRIYLATDPHCPYCKEAEAVLKSLAQEDVITFRVLLSPLPMHEGAREQSIAMLCDEKGIEALEEGYESRSSCEKGIEKVDGTLAFLESKGVRATPTFIFPDGSVHKGLLAREEILKRLESHP